jgi:iron(II)-dependent oxidoreductase
MMMLFKKASTLSAGLTLFLFAFSLNAQDPGLITKKRIDLSFARLSAAAHHDMIVIAPGKYPIGHNEGGPDGRPAHLVTLRAFAIDKTEVTNAQFAEFLNALELEVRTDFSYSSAKTHHFSEASWPELLEIGIQPNLYPLIGLDDDQVRIEVRNGRFVAARRFENHPVAESTWRGARDYCAWRGARLPSEVEWEAVARGMQGRTYPWGNSTPEKDLVYAGYPSGVTAPVGLRQRGATPEGVLDMAGSLAEWTASLFKPYPYHATDGREDQTLPGQRVTRGGDYVFDTEPEQLTGFFRNGFSRSPQNGHRHIGFRCARWLD